MEQELKNRDNEMAELTSEVSDLIPISEKLKEENECLKTEVAEGNQERIDMLGKIFPGKIFKNLEQKIIMFLKVI